jgi:hypothetical protein
MYNGMRKRWRRKKERFKMAALEDHWAVGATDIVNAHTEQASLLQVAG